MGALSTLIWQQSKHVFDSIIFRVFFLFFFLDYLKSRTTAVFSFYFDVGACWVDYDNRLKSIGFGLALG